MKKLFVAIFTFLWLGLWADEGMWLLTQLNTIYPQMQEKGCKLTPEQIYSINHTSLKDAIVLFGGYCTGEIVSPNGLLFTNHHCGYGRIQAHSTPEHDYLKNGFWARSYEEELPNPGLFVRFFVKMDDVTDKVLKGTTLTMEEKTRDSIIQKNIAEILKKAYKKYPKKDFYYLQVKPMYAGNQYFLFVYREYRDVRLVGAPPSSIGKFGFDTDNWMWPRHTGDFSIFRVYTSPDGKPAEYSPDNVPLKPKHYLPISLKGLKPGDYVMILGFPGSTERYMPSYGVEQVMKITNPNRIKIRGIRQEIMMEDMLADQKVFIQYASKYARSSNYWKYSIGQNQGLERLKVIERKKQLEQQFTDWIKKDLERQKIYGDVLNLFKEAYQKRAPYVNAAQYLRECFLYGTEYIYFASRAKKLYKLLTQENPDQEAINSEIEHLKKYAERFFKDYNPPTDKKVAAAMLKVFIEDIEPEFYPDFVSYVIKKYKTNYAKYEEHVFKKSVFTDKDRFMNFLQNPSAKTLEKDPAFSAALSLGKKSKELRSKLEVYDKMLDRAYRLWLNGLMKMQKNKIFYPDANMTIRLTYGTVGGYSPRDAVWYEYFTTLKGVMEKEDSTNFEFYVPWKLKALYNKKDFGQYAENGRMHIAFLSNNDITGGNSGSPVINANGELVGLAFDGNWEAMSGDIAFEPNLQRTISVDIRYVLFIIDKYADDDRLIKELTLRK